MAPERPERGMPVAVDLVTPDVEAARDFYGPLLGWRIRDRDTPRGLHCDADGDLVASILPAHAAPTAGWRTSFAGADLATSARQVRDAGGEVLGDGDGDGDILHAADPAGATFAVVTEPPRPAAQPGPGRPVWYELMTTDTERADAFYGTLFGYGVMAPAPEAPTYALFTLGGRPVTGRLGLPPEMAAALGSRWMVYFAAPDVDASADQAGHLGGAVLVPPTDTPTGRVAAIRDPTGATFTLLRPPGGA